MRKKTKFLTVYAVFDESTQKKLKSLQDKLFEMGYKGKQVMDIPFHVSLGSFPIEDKQILTDRIAKVCSETSGFSIKLKGVNHFRNKVLFVDKEENEQLNRLHKLFDNNYADGFSWRPHVTILIDRARAVRSARKYISQIFKPTEAKVIGIEMGEFFPAEKIVGVDFVKR
ncbi:MAG: 2'-5' RNA ligase family protein [Clostridia bacterium]|nr:2'-5' RNA ligase family protein [Clostridia bacterium]